MMNLAEFHFIRPYWLLALFPVMLIAFLLFKNKLNKGNWSSVCDAELLPYVLQEKPQHKRRWSLSTGLISAVLIVFAIAGPTWERLPTPVFRNDAALVIALDLSRSMDATDIKPSRLSMARFKITDILKQRKDGQTALIVYAGDAFTVTPLTEDRETIISQISALSTGIMPSQGSHAAIAIETAISLLKQAGLQSGEILLVSDGIDYDTTIDTVESIEGYRLSILGVGTADGAPVKLSKGGFLKDKQGNIVIPKLDSQNLASLANSGQGLYQSISQDDSDIKAILKQIDKPTEKQESKNDNLLIDQWHERGPWLLLLALPLVALNFRKGILLAFIFILPFPENSYAMEWQDLWQNQNQQAQKAFNKQNYQNAAEQFEDPAWKAAAQYKAGQFEQVIETLKDDQSVTGLYNKGNALAKAGQLPEALETYKQVLEQSPGHEDAKYNKEQVEKLLEQQKQEQQQEQDPNQQESEQKDQDQQNQDQQGDQSEQSSDQQQNNSQNQNQDQQNPESSEQQQNQEEQQDTEESQAEKAKQKQAEQNQQDEQAQAEQAAPDSEYDEAQQANEQWLNRIPDDPAGLLKRKFKYQYGKRNRKSNSSQNW